MTRRRCKWCHGPIVGKRRDAVFCSDEHRYDHWLAGNRPEKAQPRPRPPRSRPSGRQIAFRKAVDALAMLIQALAREPATLARYADRPDLCTRLAEATLREVLSEKQRARLGPPVEPDPVVVFYNDVSRVKRTRPTRRAA